MTQQHDSDRCQNQSGLAAKTAYLSCLHWTHGLLEIPLYISCADAQDNIFILTIKKKQ